MNRCPQCGTNATSGYTLCSSCKSANARRAQQSQNNSQSSIGTSSGRTGGTTYSGSTPLWGKIVTAVLALGIAVFIFSLTDTGKNVIDSISGIFGGESSQETAAMNKVRRSERSGVIMDESELDAKMAAINEFIASSASYRMSGTFQFGYPSGSSSNSVTTTVTMSYNESLDVYMFTFKNKNTSGYNIFEDPKLKGFIVSDGTYYIVRENGIIYVLSDISGEKKAVSESENGSLLNLLLWHGMENIVEPVYLLDKSPDDYYDNQLIGDDGYFFYRHYPDRGAIMWHTFLLKTYKNMPVRYEQIGNIYNSDVWFTIRVDYFYDKIPDDNPSVADWR
jgi:hypothetical protein